MNFSSHSHSRRAPALVAVLVAMVMVLAGCGSSGSDTAAGDSASNAGFPVTVEGTYGPVTVEKKPTRILVTGAETVDLLNALGEKPVAFAGAGVEPTKDDLNKSYPWIKDLYTDEFDPAIISGTTLNREVIAKYAPDLIISTSYLVDEAAYKELSKLAPTFVKRWSADRDWKDDFADLGKLVGKPDQVTTALEGVDAEYAKAKETLPGLQGKTFNMGWANQTGFRLPPAFSWAGSLGLKPAANQPALGSKAVNISLENIAELNGDIFFLHASDEQQATLRADPRFSRLPSSTNEALFFTPRPVIDAGLAVGPSSLKWLLSQILPELQASPLNKG